MRARCAVMGVAAAALLLGGGNQAAFADDDYSRPGPYMSAGFSWGKEAINVDNIEDQVTDARREQQFSVAPTCSTASPTIDCNKRALLDRQDSPGADVRFGYRFNEIFAAELNVQYFDRYELILRGTNLRRQTPFENFSSADYDIAEIQAFNFFANMRAYAWTGPLQPYGLLGIGAVYVDADTKAAPIRVPVDADNDGMIDGDPDAGFDSPKIESGSDSDVVFAGKLGGGLDYYLTNNIVLNFDISWVLTTGVDIDTLPDKIQLNQVPITTSLMYRF